MALPRYDRTKRKKTFERLPKGAYVICIKDVKEEENSSKNGTHLTIIFDIAEGDYKDIYQRRYDETPSEDKKWPHEGIHYLTVPGDNSAQFIWDNWNSFFADLEDSNNGYVFNGDLKTLKGKLIGGKFAIEQREYNGQIYDSTRLRWTCVADDVREGKAGKLPNDKLVKPAVSQGFVPVDENTDEELPF